MCALCSEEMIKKLNIQEIRRAGMELLYSAKTDEEFKHIMDRLNDLKEEGVVDHESNS